MVSLKNNTMGVREDLVFTNNRGETCKADKVDKALTTGNMAFLSRILKNDLLSYMKLLVTFNSRLKTERDIAIMQRKTLQDKLLKYDTVKLDNLSSGLVFKRKKFISTVHLNSFVFLQMSLVQEEVRGFKGLFSRIKKSENTFYYRVFVWEVGNTVKGVVMSTTYQQTKLIGKVVEFPKEMIIDAEDCLYHTNKKFGV